MLVLRVDLSGNPTFRQAVARTRQICLDGYANEEMPFEMLVEELKPERSLDQNPLFQVSFVLQNFPKTPFETADFKEVELDIDPGIARFDLHVFMTEEEGRLRGYIEYNIDLFETATTERMVAHFQTLLDGITANPEQRISDLPLLSKAESHQLLTGWNDTDKGYPNGQCVHELFQNQVERTPDAVAVVFEHQKLTYRELNIRANQLAHYLKKLGVGPEVLVGICVERSLEMMIGLLGILKAGGAYVPLDPEYPQERLAFILKDTRAAVLLTQRALVDDRRWRIEDRDPQSSILDLQHRIVCLDRDWSMIERESRENPKNEAAAEDLAYVIYTSGSTGQPKGVQITHKSLLNLVFWHHQAFSVTPIDRATQLAGTGFDAAVWELWPYLTVGATIHIPDEMTRVDAAALRDWLVAQAITISFVPTALAESLMTLDWPHDTALRVLLTGGDTLRVYPPETLPFASF